MTLEANLDLKMQLNQFFAAKKIAMLSLATSRTNTPRRGDTLILLDTSTMNTQSKLNVDISALEKPNAQFHFCGLKHQKYIESIINFLLYHLHELLLDGN